MRHDGTAASDAVPAGPAADCLDAPRLAAWAAAAAARLAVARERLDAANVYPVADGDTGANLLATWDAAVAGLPAGPPARAGDLAQALARGAAAAARGNSGVLLAQWLHGVARVWAGREQLAGADLADGLAAGAQAARDALQTPVEGTLLSVAESAALAAVAVVRRSGAPPTPQDVLAAALAAADRELAATPQRLPLLGRAGVVDAGAAGWLEVLRALAVTAGVPDVPAADERPPAATEVPGAALPAAAPAPPRSTGAVAEPELELVFRLTPADAAALDGLRRRWSAVATSLVVTAPRTGGGGAGGGPVTVHLHTRRPGPVLSDAYAAGPVEDLAVTVLPESGVGHDLSGRAVVAVADGPGLAAVFAAAGAVVSRCRPRQVAVEPASPVAVDQLVAAVEATGAAEVILLPNDSEVVAVAEQAAEVVRRTSGRHVLTVPTRSMLQGLSALAVASGRPFADEVVAMSAAAAATRTAVVAVAPVDAMTSAGLCHAGDVLGLLEDDVAVIGDDVEAVTAELLERLLGPGGELITVVTGGGAPEGVPAGLADRLRRRVRELHPFAEFVEYAGGPENCLVLLGVE